MKISKVVRRTTPGGRASLNAVIAANVGKSGSDTTASSRQDVRIVQRDGYTEVDIRDADGDESEGSRPAAAR